MDTFVNTLKGLLISLRKEKHISIISFTSFIVFIIVSLIMVIGFEEY